MKTNHVPELFFKKDQNPLVLSEKCISLNEVKTNIWVFELINLYQTLDYIATQSYQRWCFHKQEKEILVTIHNGKGNMLQGMGVDIWHHYHVFTNITLYVFEGKCITEEEFEAAIKRDSA